MTARVCNCQPAHVFSDNPGACHKCGHNQAPPRVTLHTWQTAIAIAELVLGHRRHGDNRRRPDSIVIFE